MSAHDRPLAGLEGAIERIAAGSRAPVISDVKPREQAIVRDEHGRMIHIRCYPDGTVTERLVSHHG